MIIKLPKDAQARLDAMRAGREARLIEAGLTEGWPWLHRTEPGNGAPSAKQMRYFLSRARIVVGAGSNRSGKTQISLQKLTWLGKTYPGILMACGRQKFTHTEANLLPKARKYWDELAAAKGYRVVVEEDPKSTSWMARWPNGSTCRILGFDNPWSYQGDDWNIVWVDEATHIDEASFKEIDARMSGGATGPDDPRFSYPIQQMFTMNWGPCWLHDKIAVPWMDNRPQDAVPGSEFIEFSTYDLEPKYEAERIARGDSTNVIQNLVASGLRTEAEVRGYAPPTGTVWPTPVETGSWRDVISMDEFMRVWGGVTAEERVYFGMDHGIGDATAIETGVVRCRPGTWGTGKDGRGELCLVIGACQEFYEPLTLQRPHVFIAEEMKRMMAPASDHMCWCDPNMKHGQGQSGNTLIHPMTQIMMKGIRLIKAPHTGPFGRATSFHFVGNAMFSKRIIFIRETTKNLLREMSGLMKAGTAAPKGVEAWLPLEKGAKDHACDAYRHLVCGFAGLRIIDFGVPVTGDGLLTDGEGPVRLGNEGILDRWGKPIGRDGGGGRDRRTVFGDGRPRGDMVATRTGTGRWDALPEEGKYGDERDRERRSGAPRHGLAKRIRG